MRKTMRCGDYGPVTPVYGLYDKSATFTNGHNGLLSVLKAMICHHGSFKNSPAYLAGSVARSGPLGPLRCKHVGHKPHIWTPW